tara:strand:- start:795 stop:1019 length:225 start_codon:yes stop_codon:yes gene_type:complete
MIHFGKVLILIGVFLSLVGVVLIMSDEKLKWFGNLPLDFNYGSDKIRLFLPIGSMFVLSVLLSVLINIILKWFK